MRRPVVLLLLAALGVVTAPVRAQTEQRAILLSRLQTDLAGIGQHFGGVFGARVVDLTDSSVVGVNDNLVFPTGSAIKVGILLELFRQAERQPGLLAERIPVMHAAQVGGTGVSQYFGDGTSALSIEDLAILMVTLSDNTATNILIGRLGIDSVNGTLRTLGLKHTMLRRLMIHPEASARGEENLSTPAESATLMTRLARCELPVSKASCNRMRDILEIPKDDPVREPIPPSIRVAFKPGTIEGVRVAWAYVELPGRPYVITVMTNYGADDAEGSAAVRQASEVAYRYFARLARATPYGLRVPASVLRKPPG